MLLLLSLAEANCGDFGEQLATAERELRDLHLAAVHTALDAMPQAATCGEVLTPTHLARMWTVQGVTAVLEDDATTAADSLGALHRVAPTHYDDGYGSKARAAYQAASTAPVLPATLEITPDLGANRAYLDGSPVSQSSITTQGLHLVQLSDPDGQVVFGEMFFLAPNQTRRLDTGIPPAPFPIAVVPDAPIEERTGLRGSGWLVAGGVAAGAGLATGLVAMRDTKTMRQAKTFEGLDQAYARQRTIGGVGYGLLGLSAASLSLFVARQF